MQRFNHLEDGGPPTVTRDVQQTKVGLPGRSLKCYCRMARLRFATARQPRKLSGLVPTTGLEPVRCYPLEPESSASANSATWAQRFDGHSNTCPAACGQVKLKNPRPVVASGAGSRTVLPAERRSPIRLSHAGVQSRDVRDCSDGTLKLELQLADSEIGAPIGPVPMPTFSRGRV